MVGPDQFGYFDNDTFKKISLFQLTHLISKSGLNEEVYEDLNRAWWKFIGLSQDQDKQQRLRQLCSNGLKKRRQYILRSIEKIRDSENLYQRKEEAELKGNLLLTFKNQISKGQTIAELDNIFSEDNETLIIKLNPAKSVSENARRYFEKYKNIDEKKEIIQIKKDTLHSELTEVDTIIADLKTANYSKLIRIHEKLIAMKILQSQDKYSDKPTSIDFAFKKLIIDNDWEIYIGKNGPNNDLLTFSFANKWDIWLHAQGVPGSHVVIHHTHRKTIPPRHVLEKAAQIAAANSKARFSSTVPVIYTEARYVSRIRKALPGTVNVRNEKVIFVTPLLMN